MTSGFPSLADLGWSDHFQRQLATGETAGLLPLRLTHVGRNRATGLGPDGSVPLAFPPDLGAGETAVGDWVLADLARMQVVRVLDRRSEIVRRAAGREHRRQLIAANVDTLFLVTSCDEDFSVARLERYLALAFDGGAEAVVVLTKADATAEPEAFVAQARAISPRIVEVRALDARDPAALEALSPWLGPGRTVAFLGSSGVGKSTIVSGLTGRALATQAVREDDAKGRHTTTARSLYRTAGGALVIDMPGMRELGLFDVALGIDAVFEDVAALAGACRFGDCTHGSEPGCALRAAVAAGTLDPRRLERWQKLRREDALTAEAPHERRRRDRAFAKRVKSVTRGKRRD